MKPKIHRIQFTPPNIRGLLAGRKTRYMFPVELKGLQKLTRGIVGQHFKYLNKFDGETGWDNDSVWKYLTSSELLALAPHGGVGDMHYVIEPWLTTKLCDEYSPLEYLKFLANFKFEPRIHYIADGNSGWDKANEGRYCCATHLPNALVRIKLEVASLEVKRLHDMTSRLARLPKGYIATIGLLMIKSLL